MRWAEWRWGGQTFGNLRDLGTDEEALPKLILERGFTSKYVVIGQI
jgi:hypothetical protein